MEHFYTAIQGWYNNLPKLYAQMVAEAKDGYHFVEVGCWKGASASFMTVEIINSGKKIKFDCVDTWLGSDEHQEDNYVKEGKLYEHFIDNMKPVEGYYNPIRLSSLEAAKLYEDNSLDFVLIDAAHDYESVKADIAAWLPKVKFGGVLAGDDYDWWEPVANAVNDSLDNVIADGYWFYRKQVTG